MDIPWRTAGRSCDGALRRYPFTYTKVAKKSRRRLLNTPMGCVLTNWYADGDKREGRPLSYARYEMYRTWLSFYEPTSWAMVFDFRDTFFQRDPFATARETTAGQAGLDIPPKFRQDFQGQHGISTPRPPWRRRDLPPRTIHVAAAASLRPTPKDYPRRGRRVAATPLRPAPAQVHARRPVPKSAEPAPLRGEPPGQDRRYMPLQLWLARMLGQGDAEEILEQLGRLLRVDDGLRAGAEAVPLAARIFRGRIAATPRLRRGYSADESRWDVDIPQTSRGDAAAATWIFRRRVAATPRMRR